MKKKKVRIWKKQELKKIGCLKKQEIREEVVKKIN